MPFVSDELDRLEGAPLFPWLSPTRAANHKAGKLQTSVRAGEFSSTTEVTEESIGIATIHGRQDLVLVYSLQVSIHEQLVKISRGVWVLALIAIYWRFLS
jgi:hypothetical protein